MNILEAFERSKGRNECALVAYAMAGYPDLEQSMRLVQDLSDCGADLIEIGFPFSDPVADGPTLQNAGTEALRRGVTLDRLFEAARGLRTDKPLILMSYLNPLLAAGEAGLLAGMKKAGFRGLVIPDLPVEECESWSSAAREYGIDLILLATPVSGPGRLRTIISRSRGFLYCVSLAGTTGARTSLPEDLSAFLSSVRRETARDGKPGLPIAVGFGISTPEHIRMLRDQADGVIVASRIIDAVGKGEDVKGLVTGLKKATVR
jgi:tryptophan synthase alpha chain